MSTRTPKHPFVVSGQIFTDKMGFTDWQRSYPTLEMAEQSARKLCAKYCRTFKIERGPDHIASVKIDPLDRVWTEVSTAGESLL